MGFFTRQSLIFQKNRVTFIDENGCNRRINCVSSSHFLLYFLDVVQNAKPTAKCKRQRLRSTP
jgi:hypothetical protein